LRAGDRRQRFEHLVLPHMDAAYDLALWLVRDPPRAEEAVQEAFLRAYRFLDGFRGGDARPWLLGIVRNACYTLLERERESTGSEAFEEGACSEETIAAGAVVSFPVNPETAAIESAERELVQRCLEGLPAVFREALVLREFHGCSYREIASIVAAPIGTVMSRIARGRRLLQRALAARVQLKSTGT
jgi:RNA polymerase sigma-70 factor (ECF subfamily)